MAAARVESARKAAEDSGLRQAAVEDIRSTARFDCFRATSKENTARKYGVHGVNVFARKPAY
jgi:hypothetical protein